MFLIPIDEINHEEIRSKIERLGVPRKADNHDGYQPF